MQTEREAHPPCQLSPQAKGPRAHAPVLPARVTPSSATTWGWCSWCSRSASCAAKCLGVNAAL